MLQRSPGDGSGGGSGSFVSGGSCSSNTCNVKL